MPRAVRAAGRAAAVPVETPLIAQVFAALADGRFHSGEALAGTLGVSRSAIWKAVAALKELGSELHAVRNRGYRLARGSEPLDSARIRERLTPEARALVARIDSVWSIDSTNTALLERANPAHGTCEVLLAEYQTAGRGRRGRTWLAPPGGAICLSMSWSFQEVPQDLAALGLAMGVCALRALRVHGFDGVTLKWPNDLLVAERKLGGVLIDLRAESAGPASVVIGIGLNVSLGAALLGQIAAGGTAATDLASTERPLPARNVLAAALLNACVGGLAAFARDGLKPFVEDWRAADALRGRAVSVSAADGVARGIARGIDLRGALMLETPAGLRRFISGDVSVRL
jgi:BirA family transcriptional regulator, biotin operon repressor / biotin---[acetyl-CoA-carboxylase] ligase